MTTEASGAQPRVPRGSWNRISVVLLGVVAAAVGLLFLTPLGRHLFGAYVMFKAAQPVIPDDLAVLHVQGLPATINRVAGFVETNAGRTSLTSYFVKSDGPAPLATPWTQIHGGDATLLLGWQQSDRFILVCEDPKGIWVMRGTPRRAEGNTRESPRGVWRLDLKNVRAEPSSIQDWPELGASGKAIGS